MPGGHLEGHTFPEACLIAKTLNAIEDTHPLVRNTKVIKRSILAIILVMPPKSNNRMAPRRQLKKRNVVRRTVAKDVIIGSLPAGKQISFKVSELEFPGDRTFVPVRYHFQLISDHPANFQARALNPLDNKTIAVLPVTQVGVIPVRRVLRVPFLPPILPTDIAGQTLIILDHICIVKDSPAVIQVVLTVDVHLGPEILAAGCPKQMSPAYDPSTLSDTFERVTIGEVS